MLFGWWIRLVVKGTFELMPKMFHDNMCYLYFSAVRVIVPLFGKVFERKKTSCNFMSIICDHILPIAKSYASYYKINLTSTFECVIRTLFAINCLQVLNSFFSLPDQWSFVLSFFFAILNNKLTTSNVVLYFAKNKKIPKIYEGL